jgi:hypothetical protein
MPVSTAGRPRSARPAFHAARRRWIAAAARTAEPTQHRVAHELVDDTVLLDHLVDQDREVLVQEGDDLLGAQPLGQRGVATDVAQHDGDLAKLALDLDLLRPEEPLRDLPGHVAAEHLAQALPLAQAPRHLVDAARQLAHLVLAVVRHRGLEAPLADGGRRRRHRADGPGHPSRE